MPLGIVNDSEFLAELESLDKKEKVVEERVNEIIIPAPERGRGKGNTEVPNGLRKIIQENALTEGNKNTKGLIDFLGISSSSMTAYKKGATSTTTYGEGSSELKSHRLRVRDRIHKKASRLTFRALNHITDDKLDGADATELASIARSSSAIMRDMAPDESTLIQQNQVVIFRPRMREEDDYEVIEVTE